MPEEHERKFLVRSHAWLHSARRDDHYRQGYISIDPERSVRVRAGDKKAVITVKAKTKGNGLSRSEFEYPIPLKDANQLLENVCLKPLIEKTRYEVPQNEITWTVDQFDKENRDLLLAELETDGGKKPARLPSWVGRDVSKDERYENANLVQHPYSEWGARREEPETSYHLKHSESIAEGIERIVREQLDLALWQLTQNVDSLGTAVHEARKAVKRVRSSLRLVRTALGKTYQKENEALQRLSRRLSPVRDSEGLVETFDLIKEEYAEEFSKGNFSSIRERLVGANRQFSLQFQRDGEAAKLATKFRRIRSRVKDWPWKNAGLDAVLHGFSTTIRRGRDAYETAYARKRPDNFHDWRKRAKDLRYHLQLVRNAWKPVISAYVGAAADLEGKLGDDHNLVVLRASVQKRSDQYGSVQDVRRFLNLIARHQQKLRDEAKLVGAHFYAQKPDEWRDSLKSSWKTWRKE